VRRKGSSHGQNSSTPGSEIAQYRLAYLEPPPNAQSRSIQLSYRFVKRPGVDLKVTRPDPYHVEILVGMDPATYSAPQPPACTTTTLSLEQVDALAGWSNGTLRTGLNAGLTDPAVTSVANIFLSGLTGGWIPPNPGPNPVATGALNIGVLMDKCTLPSPPNPTDSGETTITTDSGLPYPVYGWVHMNWTDLSRQRPNQLAPTRP
jgi:hypothetical protein